MPSIAIFASGTGSNAENIMRHFEGHANIYIKLVLSNKADAPVIDKAIKHGVAVQLVNRAQWLDKDNMTSLLDSFQIDFIVLAGFLWLIPDFLVDKYPDRIVNIHPALLPSYGGKGMYGNKVHEEVLRNKEPKTGITIHFVNNEYDKGKIIFQAEVPVLPHDTPESIAQKVHTLEYQHYPQEIEKVINRL